MVSLKRQAHAELRHARPVGDVAVERRLTVQGVALVDRVAAVVRVIEYVEHLDDAVDAQAAADRNTLLEPQVDAVNRIADELVARHNRAVGAQPHFRQRPFIASVDSGIRTQACAGAKKVDPAHLQAFANVPDAVGREAVALIGDGIRVLAAHIRRQREADRPVVDDPVAADEPLLADWARIVEVGKRVAGRKLPVVAIALGQGEIGAVVVGPPRQPLEVHDAPVGERSQADGVERVVRAGCGVV